MQNKDLTTLEINILSQQQLERITNDNTIVEDGIYLTPDTSISYTPQELTEEQQAQARSNLDVYSIGQVDADLADLADNLSAKISEVEDRTSETESDIEDIYQTMNSFATTDYVAEIAVGQKTSDGGEIFNDYDNNTAAYSYAHAEGHQTTASGEASHAEGFETTAEGSYSHTEGVSNKASGLASHTEGGGTRAIGMASHAEGANTTASGEYSHSEGSSNYMPESIEGLDLTDSESIKTNWLNGPRFSLAKGKASHVEGEDTLALGDMSHAEGSMTMASGMASHAEGCETVAAGIYSHTEGYYTTAFGNYSHTEGSNTVASGKYAHAEGEGSFSGVDYFINSLGYSLEEVQSLSTAQIKEVWTSLSGGFSWAKGEASHIEGKNNLALGGYSHTEGEQNIAEGVCAHAEGYMSSAKGEYSHAESNSTASGYCAHAEGASTVASGQYSHAEGATNTVSGDYSHVEGYENIVTGDYGAHAEGSLNKASGSYSHVEGVVSESRGPYSHAEGEGTIATGCAQHVQGRCNIEDNASLNDGYGNYAHIVGNGTDLESENRSNAHTLDWSGNAWFAGDVYVGSTSGTNKDAGSKKLATEDFVESNFAKVDSENLADGAIMIFDQSKNKLVDSGYTIDTFKQWVRDYIEGYMSTTIILKDDGSQNIVVNGAVEITDNSDGSQNLTIL